MSLPNTELEIGMPGSPFQSTVHEPWLAVWRNAMVRNLSPDWAESVAGLSPA